MNFISPKFFIVLQVRGWGLKDGLIFLIDCSKSMFDKNGEEESPFEKCIRVS